MYWPEDPALPVRRPGGGGKGKQGLSLQWSPRATGKRGLPSRARTWAGACADEGGATPGLPAV